MKRLLILLFSVLLLALACKKEKVIIEIESLQIDPSYTTMEVGDQLELTLIITPSNATEAEISWRSSNEATAMVSGGTVVAFAEGRALITAYAAGKQAICVVTVVPRTIPVTDVTLAPESAVMTVGETLQLTASVTPEDATDKTVSWRLVNPDDSSFLSVSDKGEVTALSHGKGTVEARCGSCSASCSITVYPKEGMTFYVYDGNGWGGMNLYAWNSDGSLAEWPGVGPEAVENLCGYRYYRFDLAPRWCYTDMGIVLNDGAGHQSADYFDEWVSGKTYYMNVSTAQDAAGHAVIEPIEDPLTFFSGEDPTGTLFFEDFENKSTLARWSFIDADGDGFNWRISDEVMGAEGHSHGEGNLLLLSQSYDQDRQKALSPDNWAFTPAIRLGYKNNYLSFWLCAQDDRYPEEHYAVYVTDQEPAAENLSACIKLQEGNVTQKPSYGAPGSPRAMSPWEHHIVQLPASLKGKNVRIAFRHFNSSDLFYIDLDDITVTTVNPQNAPAAAPEAGQVQTGVNSFRR